MDSSELLSNCCGAPMFGEADPTAEDVIGRCTACMEMAVFEEAV